MKFFEASAKGNINVLELFTNFTSEILELKKLNNQDEDNLD